ncbi:hypothetical protein [Streptomyces sp. NPDC001985]|uniref:hypothetical protein n=1 Tax=Streptomyces sp. NPDC001985 TaxID=3154406 RepID=UPI00332402D1
MGDNGKQELTHEQQQAADSTQIQTRFGATDAIERVLGTLEKFGLGSGSGPGGFFGKTDFENARLNAMIDLLEAANPTDLENAGDALQRATKALNKAAGDLDAFVKGVEWTGESGTEFRRFGAELSKYAGDLGTFANAVGTQMKVASEGLTSVRNSKPPRDTRADPKKPEHFPDSERKQDNPEYVAAQKAEKDRQEAINQMNRLASFYAVSEQTLAGKEPPRMPGALSAAVPRPLGRQDPGGGGNDSDAARADTPGQGSVPQRALNMDVVNASQGQPVASVPTAPLTSTAPAPTPTAPGPVTQAPAPDTSMQIDSVAAPPSTPAAPAAPTPSSNAPGGTPNSQVPPVTAGIPNAGQSKAAPPAQRAPGASKVGGAPPVGAGGRPQVGGAPPARYAEAGRSGPMSGGPGSPGGSQAGRAGATGPMGGGAGSQGAARAGTPGGAPQSPMAGRAGTAAGQQMAGRPGSGSPAAGSRAGRADGIVGGTPQRAAGGSTAPRAPRGTVIGADGPASNRASAARPGQSGVIGTGPARNAPAGRGIPSANGIVGTPRSGGTGPRSANGGFTAGGAGLTGGRPGRQHSPEEERDQPGSTRPDYLTEDEETWAVRRRVVPPVID